MLTSTPPSAGGHGSSSDTCSSLWCRAVPCSLLLCRSAVRCRAATAWPRGASCSCWSCCRCAGATGDGSTQQMHACATNVCVVAVVVQCCVLIVDRDMLGTFSPQRTWACVWSGRRCCSTTRHLAVRLPSFPAPHLSAFPVPAFVRDCLSAFRLPVCPPARPSSRRTAA